MCDSCGIFVVGQDVAAEVLTNVSHLHADDDAGFFGAAVRRSATSPSTHLRMGLGSLLTAICTKRWIRTIGCMAHFVTMSGGDRASSLAANILKTKEKRLNLKVWTGAKRYGGSHFPLCVFTRNMRKRSEAARNRRAARRNPTNSSSRNASRDHNRSSGNWSRDSWQQWASWRWDDWRSHNSSRWDWKDDNWRRGWNENNSWNDNAW